MHYVKQVTCVLIRYIYIKICQKQYMENIKK